MSLHPLHFTWFTTSLFVLHWIDLKPAQSFKVPRYKVPVYKVPVYTDVVLSKPALESKFVDWIKLLLSVSCCFAAADVANIATQVTQALTLNIEQCASFDMVS